MIARHIVGHVAAARRHGFAAARRRVPRTQPPMLIESDYSARLVGIIDRIRAAGHHLVGALPTVLRSDAIRLDEDPGSRARHLVDRARREVEHATDPDALLRLATDFGGRVSEHQRGQIGRQAKAALGVNIHTLDRTVPDLIQGFAHENVSLIKSLQGRSLDAIETMVTRAVADGTRAADLGQQIAERYDIAERHARLIARDQIGKLNSRIAEARNTEIGVTSYKWLHVGNANPRPHHVARSGRTFHYDSPPSDGHPGIAICCHCLQQPVFDDIYAELDALGV